MTVYDVFNLIGGLGLVLYGMKLMSDGLEKAAGEKLKRLMGILTTNRFRGFLVGVVVAAIIQSSGATIMVVGFVNAGLMTLSQAVGVIMGTNIGTALLTQVMALDIGKFAPLMIMMGVIPVMFSKQRNHQMLGQIFVGFGVLFLGMTMMQDAMRPLRDMPAFQNLMLRFNNPLFGLLIGTLVTAVIQSSAASVVILQQLARQGLIVLSSATYLMLGFNIGTTSSAAIGCIGAGRSGRRAAIMHTAIKALGALIFVAIIQFLPLVEWLQRLSPGNVVWQIANVHLVFNLINTLLLFPFAQVFVKLALKILPVRPSEKRSEAGLQFVNDNMLLTPSIAMQNVIKETVRMGEVAMHAFSSAMSALLDGASEGGKAVAHDEKILNLLNRDITAFLAKLSRHDLTRRDAALVSNLYHVVSDIERIGDHAENIVEYTGELIENNFAFSSIAVDELRLLADTAYKVLDRSLKGLASGDVEASLDAARLEQQVDIYAKAFRQNHIERMRGEICDPLSGTIFTDTIINLERMADHAYNIAERVIAQGHIA
jgi:phosphate:Na+ symporter